MMTREGLKQGSLARHGLSAEKRALLNSKWIKYWDIIAGKLEGGIFVGEPIIEYLMSEGLLCGGTILDIGCGTGQYTIPFAKNSAKVTALDMSPKMIEVLRRRVDAEKSSHIEIVQAMWEDYHTEEKFDMVFASMCPAVCDEESLLKMESMSSRWCVLIGPALGSFAKNRTELRAKLMEQKPKGLSPDPIHVFNYLYDAGRHPNMRSFTLSTKEEMTEDDAIHLFSTYYAIFGIEDERANLIIRDYVRANLLNGCFVNEQTMINAVIWWAV